MGQKVSKVEQVELEGGEAPEVAVNTWRQQFPLDGNSDFVQDHMNIAFCCRDVAKMDFFSPSDPFLKVYIREKNPEEAEILKYFVGDELQVQGSKAWTLLSETPYINDEPNPIFTQLMQLNYKPSKIQHIRVEVYDFDLTTAHDFIGASEFTISEILTAKSSSITRAMQSIRKQQPTGYTTVMLFDDSGQPFKPAFEQNVPAESEPPTRSEAPAAE